VYTADYSLPASKDRRRTLACLFHAELYLRDPADYQVHRVQFRALPVIVKGKEVWV
jgi:hypothetical protein